MNKWGLTAIGIGAVVVIGIGGLVYMNHGDIKTMHMVDNGYAYTIKGTANSRNVYYSLDRTESWTKVRDYDGGKYKFNVKVKRGDQELIVSKKKARAGKSTFDVIPGRAPLDYYFLIQDEMMEHGIVLPKTSKEGWNYTTVDKNIKVGLYCLKDEVVDIRIAFSQDAFGSKNLNNLGKVVSYYSEEDNTLYNLDYEIDPFKGPQTVRKISSDTAIESSLRYKNSKADEVFDIHINDR